MGFKAVEVQDVLDYDFNPFVDAVGVTPEPSMARVKKYQQTVKAAIGPALTEAAQLEEETGGKVTAKVLSELLNSEKDKESEEIFLALIDATAELCQNKPTKAQIQKLPWRMQQHFVGYIAGKFFSGEASTPVMTR